MHAAMTTTMPPTMLAINPPLMIFTSVSIGLVLSSRSIGFSEAPIRNLAQVEDGGSRSSLPPLIRNSPLCPHDRIIMRDSICGKGHFAIRNPLLFVRRAIWKYLPLLVSLHIARA